MTDLHSLEKPLIQALSEEIGKDWRCDSRPMKCHDHSLLSSCWQKSIRRGRVDEAIRCALALHSQNPEYVWRRIRAISLEEVSVADLQLVAQILAIAGKRSMQRKLGERALLSSLTARLATTPKCRTACDLLVWLPQALRLVEYKQQPEFDLEALIASDAAQLRHTAEIWHSITPRSIRTRTGWRVMSRGDARKRDAWLEEAGVPPLVRYIVQRGSNTDALNVLLVPAYQLAKGGVHGTPAESPTASSLDKIGGLPAYSYCLYSGPGRSALRHFLMMHRHWRERFREMGVTDPFRALGHLVFHVEGDYCARPVSFPRGAEIKALSEAATLARCGVPSAAIPDLEDRVTQAMPALNISRRLLAANKVGDT